MTAEIHPTAIVQSGAALGDRVIIGPFTVVYANARIGADTRIDGHCQIGYPSPLAEGQPLVIGAGSVVRSHCIFYEGSRFGPGLTTGHHATVREKTIAGRGLQIGTFADIQGHCTIGHYVRTQSSVTIGQRSRIGNFVWMFPGVLLTNDPNPPSDQLEGVTLEDYVVVAVKATLLPGVTVGKGSFVTAHALVGQSMPENSLISGSPAHRVARATDMRIKQDIRTRAYPWNKRFVRGYPQEVVEAWSKNVDGFELDDPV